MVIVSEYDVIAIGDDEFLCVSHEESICPFCGSPLRFRDCRRRIMKTYGGETMHILLRRLVCKHCKHIHIELPDILVPRKHYALEVIENVVDGVSTVEDESTEDYPCESTMLRWKDWVSFNISQIEGWLRSVGHRVLGIGAALLSASGSLVRKLRDDGAGWLAVCERAIYNSGGSLLVRPPQPFAPALP